MKEYEENLTSGKKSSNFLSLLKRVSFLLFNPLWKIKLRILVAFPDGFFP